MKKFYYKKDVSLDKTPIILRLERRRTVKVSSDDGEGEQGRLSVRSTSISGLDQLKYDPPVPRTRVREVTKSLSEDVLSKCNYRTPPGVVITEEELSSSWLYKSMKANANSSDEKDNKAVTNSAQTQEEQSLSPKVLKDPKMKPIPVPVSRHSKITSSCCCYLAIMITVILCTIGFLSIIGGILYMELISNGNITVYSTEKTTDTAKQSHSAQMQNLEEPTEVIIQRETVESLNQTDNWNDSEVPVDHQKTLHILDFGKPLGAEQSQYIDNTRTEVRIRNENSIIYEENLNDSVRYEQNSDAYPGNENKQNFQENNTERNLPRMAQNLNESKEVLAKKDEKIIKLTETNMDLKSDQSTKLNLTEKDVLFDLKVTSNSVKEDLEQAKSDEKLKSAIFTESTKDQQSLERKSTEKLRKELNPGKDIPSVIKELIDPNTTDRNGEKRITKIFNDSFTKQNLESLDKSGTELKFVTNLLPTDSNKHENISNETNKDEPMILIIDDSEYESHQEDSKKNSYISKRHGNLPLRLPHSRTKTSARIKTGEKHSDVPAADLVQRFRQQVRLGEIKTAKKPVNRVTVAEVMKQLKELDVNSKLASFRMKPVKPNIKNIKMTPKIIPRKQLKDTLEKQQYLEKLRAMLYDRFP